VDNTDETAQKNDMDKPLYLRDYHRKNLLENGGGPVEETDDNIEPLPYVLEQEALKSSIVREINAEGEREMEDASENDDFLVKKERSATDRTTSKPAIPNISTADEDPENFLSNFFASRAWVPTDTAKFHPLESDDEEEQARADKFENAWNLRFEDPDTSNKTLTSHSRDIVAKYSVRREEITGRKKAREREKERKLEEKKEREEEKKLLRSLKISEMEQKLEKIRDAAGLSGKSVSIEEWTDMLEGDWDDDEWNEQMQARFGEDYYEKDDNLTDANNVEPSKAKPEKPKWGDDIDINDLVPEFNDEDDPITAFRDSDDEQSQQPENATRNRAEARNQARRDRRIIEALADQSLPLDVEMGQSSKPSAPFRYRETSPNSFGLTPLDIFAAEDAQLNQFVGLKKLATFRDPERKRKDKKKLGKKARLRSWRKETFGLEEGPPLQSVFSIPTTQDQTLSNMEQVEITDVENGTSLKHQKKRKRKSKAKS
jgi:protein KRI1